jgi:HTH-type transcriptional regulator / antitoxin HigA
MLEYENEHYHIEPSTAVEAIKFRMKQQDLSQAIGRPNRVYEILNDKRKLTRPMIKRFNHLLNISLDSLIH